MSESLRPVFANGRCTVPFGKLFCLAIHNALSVSEPALEAMTLDYL